MLSTDPLWLDTKDLDPETKVGMNPQKSFAGGDEDRYVHDRVWGEVMKIHPIVKHQTPGEGVEREAQSPKELGDEHYPLPRP